MVTHGWTLNAHFTDVIFNLGAYRSVLLDFENTSISWFEYSPERRKGSLADALPWPARRIWAATTVTCEPLNWRHPDMAGITILGLGPGDPCPAHPGSLGDTQRCRRGIFAHQPASRPSRGFLRGWWCTALTISTKKSRLLPRSTSGLWRRSSNWASRPEGVLYAVPGHPFVAETTGPEIARLAAEKGIPGYALLKGSASSNRLFQHCA